MDSRYLQNKVEGIEGLLFKHFQSILKKYLFSLNFRCEDVTVTPLIWRPYILTLSKDLLRTNIVRFANGLSKSLIVKENFIIFKMIQSFVVRRNFQTLDEVIS